MAIITVGSMRTILIFMNNFQFFKKLKKDLTNARRYGILVKQFAFTASRQEAEHGKRFKIGAFADCYGTLLTDRQRQMIQLYYDEDLSLGEIAQIIGISRQAVRDSVKRSEQILYDMEAHLHVAARMTALREQYEAIAAALQTIAQAAEQPDLVRQQCAAGQALVQDGKQLLFWTEDLEPEAADCIS